MHLDGGLGCAKGRPVEQRETQIDGRGVERIDRVGQIQTEVGIAVELSCTTDEQSGQIGPDAPVARFVRIGQGRAMYTVAQSHRIQLAAVGRQRHLDVAQRLAPRQLSKRHDAKLFGTRQASHAGIARIAIHDASKARPGNKLHDLCKQRLACVHGMAPRILTPGIYPKTQKQDSNRHQAKSAEKPRQNSLFKNPRPV